MEGEREEGRSVWAAFGTQQGLKGRGQDGEQLFVGDIGAFGLYIDEEQNDLAKLR
jgi:hypothetical protein